MQHRHIQTTPISIDEKFGLAVVNLVEKFGFADNHVTGAYFLATRAPTVARGLKGFVWYFRGVVVHETYLDIRAGKHDYKEVIWYCLMHMHDLLLRMILTALGFKGRYQPVVMLGTAAEAVDWVRPEHSTRRCLGMVAIPRGDSQSELQEGVPTLLVAPTTTRATPQD